MQHKEYSFLQRKEILPPCWLKHCLMIYYFIYCCVWGFVLFLQINLVTLSSLLPFCLGDLNRGQYPSHCISNIHLCGFVLLPTFIQSLSPPETCYCPVHAAAADCQRVRCGWLVAKVTVRCSRKL